MYGFDVEQWNDRAGWADQDAREHRDALVVLGAEALAREVGVSGVPLGLWDVEAVAAVVLAGALDELDAPGQQREPKETV